MTDDSKAQRSQVTGHLLITMPKANGFVKKKPKHCEKRNVDREVNMDRKNNVVNERSFLEVDPKIYKCVDIGNIMNSVESDKCSVLKSKSEKTIVVRENSPDFVDNQDVPPLM